MPYCDACSACVPVRILVDEFMPRRSLKRIARINSDLVATRMTPAPSSEQYSLFRAYIDARHADGGMADMSVLDFAAMVDESFVDTRIAEYRLNSRKGGALVAAVLFDVLEDGLSLIYSFFEPDLANRSLGSFVILDSIRRAERMGLSYVYLGYWVKGSGKMAYKAKFLPQE